jgi:hypothetical protein
LTLGVGFRILRILSLHFLLTSIIIEQLQLKTQTHEQRLAAFAQRSAQTVSQSVSCKESKAGSAERSGSTDSLAPEMKINHRFTD